MQENKQQQQTFLMLEGSFRITDLKKVQEEVSSSFPRWKRTALTGSPEHLSGEDRDVQG